MTLVETKTCLSCGKKLKDTKSYDFSEAFYDVDNQIRENELGGSIMCASSSQQRAFETAKKLSLLKKEKNTVLSAL